MTGEKSSLPVWGKLLFYPVILFRLVVGQKERSAERKLECLMTCFYVSEICREGRSFEESLRIVCILLTNYVFFSMIAAESNQGQIINIGKGTGQMFTSK
ncbi:MULTISPECIES: hypothetical protein [Geobacillus]|uniref:hypothetical protein n=1 Tax=Geobacillus TaxID=129337 RepID=UPI000FFEA841|nr:hypothetical protein [Geobacillus genomosp. 3]